MRFKDLKIASKLLVAFGVLMALFLTVAGFSLVNLTQLSTTQKESIQRAEDLLEINGIALNVANFYTVVADGIINRNYEESNKLYEEAKTQADHDINRLIYDENKLVDTEEELAWGREFESHYREYLKLFELNILPILKKGEDAFQRIEDLLMIEHIQSRVSEVYTVMADGFINQNYTVTAQEFLAMEEELLTYIAVVGNLADTETEKADAKEFGSQLTQYLNTFKERALPMIRVSNGTVTQAMRNLDEQLDRYKVDTIATLEKIVLSLDEEKQEAVSDDQRMKEVDESIDQIRFDTLSTIQKIQMSLENETIEANEQALQKITSFMTALVVLVIVATLTAFFFLIVISRGIARPLLAGLGFSSKIASGDLTATIDIEQMDEVGRLVSELRRMKESLSGVLQGVKDNAGNVSSGSQQISNSSQQISSGANEQAASTEEISSSMEELSSNIQQNTENAVNADKIAREASAQAAQGGESVNQTVEAMRSIAEKISVIEDISRNTNMLALNAAIEAARAGDAGKGFAVVAAEVRKLAENSGKAAAEITEISTSSVEAAETAGTIISELVPRIQKTAELVQEITMASQEQNRGAEQINSAIQQLDTVIQQNASSAEELASMSEELNSQSDAMMQGISYFKLNEYERTTRALPAPSNNQGKGTEKNPPAVESESLEITHDNQEGFEEF